MRQIAGHSVTAHALTHAHPDHQGASHAVCTALGIPLWCGEGDADAMETPGGIARQQKPGLHQPPAAALLDRARAPRRAAPARGRRGRRASQVLEVPGHSAGHVAYWREHDRALILGDVLNNVDPRTGRKGLREPLEIFTPGPGPQPRVDPPACGARAVAVRVRPRRAAARPRRARAIRRDPGQLSRQLVRWPQRLRPTPQNGKDEA